MAAINLTFSGDHRFPNAGAFRAVYSAFHVLGH